MLARVQSGALQGIEAVVVDVEIDMSLGLPYFNVVGLPEGAVKESKVRVISALKNTGFDLPQKRITVNLAPADIRSAGAASEERNRLLVCPCFSTGFPFAFAR